jgi:response regulator NasT
MNSSLRIAVADDEPDMRDYFSRILPRLGHQVVVLAQTGRELVERCREVEPDLIITDIKMPEMDGIEAATLLYEERSIPVILVSAYHDPELIERAEADHIMGYLVKPIKQSDLAPMIGLAMRRFEQLQQLRQEASDLRQALEDRKVIERAKGVLRKRAGVDEVEAFGRLQKAAADGNLKLVEAARRVLSGNDPLPPSERV